MPLIKSTSKSAFESNIARERSAGRPGPQAVAIAYSTRREAAEHPHHSRHIEEMGSAYENHTASGGPRKPYHPQVTAARSRTPSDDSGDIK